MSQSPGLGDRIRTCAIKAVESNFFQPTFVLLEIDHLLLTKATHTYLPSIYLNLGVRGLYVFFCHYKMEH